MPVVKVDGNIQGNQCRLELVCNPQTPVCKHIMYSIKTKILQNTTRQKIGSQENKKVNAASFQKQHSRGISRTLEPVTKNSRVKEYEFQPSPPKFLFSSTTLKPSLVNNTDSEQEDAVTTTINVFKVMEKQNSTVDSL